MHVLLLDSRSSAFVSITLIWIHPPSGRTRIREGCCVDVKGHSGLMMEWHGDSDQSPSVGSAIGCDSVWSEGHEGNHHRADESSDDGAGGLADAFDSFHRKAEARIRDLFAANEQRLFADASEFERLKREDDAWAEACGAPAHGFMSDHARSLQPPDLNRWRSTFPYLRAVAIGYPPECGQDHIQLVGAASKALDHNASQCASNTDGTSALCVTGVQCRSGGEDNNAEETLAIEGVVEEWIVFDDAERPLPSRDEHLERTLGRGPLSPKAARVEEAVNEAVVQAFADAAVNEMVVLMRELLLCQQRNLRYQRERQEATMRKAKDEERREAEAARQRAELAMLEAEDQASLHERLRLEAAAREQQRLEEMRRQELEENDEEEIKIRTLAYSHTREWYQPNKKCFSHRGRQLTYLKPVLRLHGKKENQGDDTRCEASKHTPRPARPSARSPLKHKFRSPPLVQVKVAIRKGRNGSRVEAAPVAISSTQSSITTNSVKNMAEDSDEMPRTDQQNDKFRREVSRGSGRWSSKSPDRKGVVLPLIAQCAPPGRQDNAYDSQAVPSTRHKYRIASPSKVYSASPYQIPPRLLMQTQRARDSSHSQSLRTMNE